MITFLLVFLGVSAALTGLDPRKIVTQYQTRVWDLKSGLPANSVYALRQTHDGFLWIGTQEGLVRFDGVDFELFTREKIPQLKDNQIRALYQDRDRALWIGTNSGGLTRFKDGEFTTYPVNRYKSLSGIKAIDEDRWGNLWIGSLKMGLTRLSRGRFTTYTTTGGLPGNQVRFIYKDANRDLWVTTSAGIVKLIEPGLFRPVSHQNPLPGLKTACLYDTDTESLWIGTGEHGLFRLRDRRVSAYGTEQGLPHLTLYVLFKDRMKNLWIGTDGGGLTRMTNGVSGTLSSDRGPALGSVSSIYEDREGSLWVGTLDSGLHQLRDTKFTTFTTREGLTHDYIHCIHEARGGGLWVGTENGLNRLKNGKITRVITTADGLSDNAVLAVLEDGAGYLRIGTWGGLNRFKNGKTLTLTKPFTLTKENGLSDNRVRCLLEDKQGNTWVGTENGLNRFDPDTGKITVFTTADGLSSNVVRFILEDRGTLRVGTDAGLNFLKDGRLTHFRAVAGAENSSFRCAYRDKEGTLWFGTDAGLIRLKGEKAVLFTFLCGLIENDVYSILEDEHGRLWLGGRNGVSRVGKKELENFSNGTLPRVRPHSYNEMDGMKSRWCTGGGCKTRDGTLWFPTSEGVTMIHPGRIKTNTLAPAVIIKKFIVDDKPVTIPAETPGTPPLELGPGKKRLEFHYTGVSFINPRRMRFKLKLDGYDSDWIDAGKTRRTTYTLLPPGKYTFTVTACNHDGLWDPQGASFSFYLKPYFSQTIWFYLSIALLAGLFVFAGYRFRVRQLKTRAGELRSQVAARTRDLEERNIQLENAQQKIEHSKDLIEAKNRQLEKQSHQLKDLDEAKSRFFANISHDFRTPLTLIMGPLEQILSEPPDRPELEKKTEMMLRNSQRLLALIDQLLELSKFDSGKVKLHPHLQNIVPFLKGVVASFEPAANQNELDLTFHTENEEQDITLYFDPEKLEEVLFNLLSNAVKFTPAGGKITVTVTRNREERENFPSGSVDISVCDTGPGIPAEQAAHIFDRFYQADSTYEYQKKGTGIGLAIAKELVELHHGRIHVKSREGEGTKFLIHLRRGVPADYREERGIPLDIKEASRAVVHEGPRAVVLEGPHAVALEGPHAVGKNIILVVEDNADVREYIRGSLEPLYTVMDAKDGREGIQKAQEIIPDLIISDIMMPGADGYELCRVLKTGRATSHIPIILLTAKAAEENIIRGLETGADDYITKPFNTKILCARIKNLIDLRAHLQQTLNREMTLQPAKMPVSPIDKEFLTDLQAVINKNVSDPGLNVEELSRKLYMGRATLYRKIHALSGESPTELIRSYRLKRGAELLKNTNLSVLEVAFEVGFSSANYFTKCFKKKFHQLPTTYQTSESG